MSKEHELAQKIFNEIFDYELLAKMEKAGIIDQSLGFECGTVANITLELEEAEQETMVDPNADGWVSVDVPIDDKFNGEAFQIVSDGESTVGYYSAFHDGYGDPCEGKCFYVRNSDSDYGGMFKAEATLYRYLPQPPTT